MSAELRRRVARGAIFSAGVFALYVAAILTPFGQRADAAGLGLLEWTGWIGNLLGSLRTVFLVVTLLGAAASIVAAVLRRRFALAVSATAVLVGVVIVNSLLRDVILHRPYFGITFGYLENTFPSGHVAASVIACIIVIAVFPRPLPRGAVAAIGVFLFLLAVGSVTSFAHRPSDVIAGALLAGAFAQGIVGKQSHSMRPRTTVVLLAAGFAGILALVGAVLLLDRGLDLLGGFLYGVSYLVIATAAITAAMSAAPGAQSAGASGR